MTYWFGYAALFNIPVMYSLLKMHFVQYFSRPAVRGYVCNFLTLPTWRQFNKSYAVGTVFSLFLLRVDFNKGCFDV